MTTKTKQSHTPGEWQVADDHTRIVGITVWRSDGDAKNFERICRNVSSTANAQLVASAPELLEACKLAASRCKLCNGTGRHAQIRPMRTDEHGARHSDDRIVDCDLCAPFRNAITKAEGR